MAVLTIDANSLADSPPANMLNLGGMMSKLERVVMVSLALTVAPKRVLEIGVNEGRCARMLLDNVPSITEYHGVDVLPGYVFEVQSQRPELPSNPGVMCRGYDRFKLDVLPNGLYDIKPGALGMFDMIIIDGDHALNAVTHDTQWADQCINRNGIIVWHDAFSWSDDINAFLNARALTHTIYHAENTMLAWERVTT